VLTRKKEIEEAADKLMSAGFTRIESSNKLNCRNNKYGIDATLVWQIKYAAS
jgi:hypothetical protein